MVILVDTDIIIDYLRVSDKQNTLYFRLFTDRSTNIAAVSFITVIELYAGKEMGREEKRNVVEKIISYSQILDGNQEFYQLAGEILRHYTIKFQDGLIAAHALLFSLPLLTKNRKDFKKIKGLKLFDY